MRGWKDVGLTTAKEDNIFERVGLGPMALDDFLKKGFTKGQEGKATTVTQATDNLAKTNNNNVRKIWTENVDQLDVNQYGRMGMIADNLDERTVETRTKTREGTLVKTTKYVNGKMVAERTELIREKTTSPPQKNPEPTKQTNSDANGAANLAAFNNPTIRKQMEDRGYFFDQKDNVWRKKEEPKKEEPKKPVETRPKETVVDTTKVQKPVTDEAQDKERYRYGPGTFYDQGMKFLYGKEDKKKPVTDDVKAKDTAKVVPKDKVGTVEQPKTTVVEKREPEQVKKQPEQEKKEPEQVVLKVPVNKETPTVTDMLNERGKSVKKPPGKPTIAGKKAVDYPERPVMGLQPKDQATATRPAAFYTKARNLPPGHIPLNIKWELGPCKAFCQKNGKMEEYALLKKLLFKAAAVLRMYIHVPETIPRRVVVPSGNVCPDFYLPDARMYDAHLVMLGRIFVPTADEKNTIASSMYCQKDENDRNRAVIGRINFAADKILNRKSTPAQHWNYINTIVHEVLHTLAFHSTFEEVLQKKEVSKDLDILATVKKLKPKIYDDGHWIEESFPNDIMVPVSIPGNILSAASTELISHTSPDFAVNKKDLVYDSFLSSVSSLEDFIKYRCDEDEPATYPFFCSQHDRDHRKSKCSADYVYMSFCGDTRYSNNCYKVTPYSNGNCMDMGLNDPNSPFMRRGPHARCFETNTKSGSLCLEFKVVGSSVQVILGSSVVECTKSGEWMEGKYFTNDGSGDYYPVNFRCPDIDKFIKQAKLTSCPDDCNHNGFCSAGKCICLDGYDNSTNCKKDSEVQLNENMFSEHMGITLSNKA